MAKQKYDWEKIKMEFMLSEYDEVAPFMKQRYNQDTTINKQVAKMTKWWWKEKQEYKQKIYEKALKKKWNETAKEISDIAKRYEMLDEEFIAWMEQQFEENKRTPKKGEKVRKLFSGDILNMWKISRTERWLPVNISKVEQTNKEERTWLTDDETEALKELLKKSSK